MSAAGRPKPQEAIPGMEDSVGPHPEEFYETPPDAVDPILRDPLHPRSMVPPLREPAVFLDVGAGRGALSARVFARWPKAIGWGIEINPHRAREARARVPELVVECADFLAMPLEDVPRVNLVIGNPPFKLARPFAERALLVADEVAFLLRVGWHEGEERVDFHEEHPHDMGILVNRPGFRGRGNDSATYAWFLWGHGRGGRFVRLYRELPTPRGGSAQLGLF